MPGRVGRKTGSPRLEDLDAGQSPERRSHEALGRAELRGVTSRVVTSGEFPTLPSLGANLSESEAALASRVGLATIRIGAP